MTSHGAAPRAIHRLLVAVVAVAGLLAMHGLISQHDPDKAPQSSTVGAQHGHSVSMARTTGAANVAARPDLGASPTVIGAAAEVTAQPVRGTGGHTMAGACVAVLASSLMLLLSGTSRRSLCTARERMAEFCTGSLSALARAGPSPCTPSLSTLCVSRT